MPCFCNSANVNVHQALCLSSYHNRSIPSGCQIGFGELAQSVSHDVFWDDCRGLASRRLVLIMLLAPVPAEKYIHSENAVFTVAEWQGSLLLRQYFELQNRLPLHTA